MKLQKKTTNLKDPGRLKADLTIEPPAPVSIDKASVDEGRKPLPSRRPDVAALRAQASALYGIPPAGLAALAPIETGFKFSPLESDEEFHYLQVEPLLEQAAELLRGCLSERARRDELAIEKWKLQLELDQFFRVDQVHERERQAGIDTLPYERAALEGAAEGSSGQNHGKAEEQLKTLLEDQVAAGFNRSMAARQLTAWLTSYPLKDNELGGDEAMYTFDNVHKSKPDLLYDAARMAGDEEAWEKVFTLMSRRYAEAAAAEKAKLRKQGLDLLANYSRADIAFRRQKAQAARDGFWEKVYQVQSPDSLLNYNQKIAPAERRFATGFREALARLEQARRGLKELYGWEPPFPKEGSAGYLDEVDLWVSGARHRVKQFAQRDQTYVLAVSLKELAPGQWESGRAASQWTFDLPEQLFGGQSHVRLRGLGLAVVGPKPEEPDPKQKGAAKKAAAAATEGPATEGPKADGFWSAHVSVPPAATVRFQSGATHELDQKAVPVLHLGRVGDQGSSPEIAGADILHNASPIGRQWRLVMSPKSTAAMGTEKLQDVLVYLRVAVRSSRIGG
jgi:hypothetical protein